MEKLGSGGKGPVGTNVALGPTKRTISLLTGTFHLKERRGKGRRKKEERKGTRKHQENH